MKQWSKKTKSGRLYKFEEFDSFLELKRANESRSVNPEWVNYRLTPEEVRGNTEWYGIESYERAYELLENGWQDATDKCSKDIKKVVQTGVSTRTKYEQNVYGFMPLVPLALQNIPNAMLNTVKREIKSKVITIVYDNCALSNISANQLLEAGKNVVSVIIELEKLGYRVELKLARYNYNSKRDEVMSCNTVLKKASQPMNLKKMMYPIAHPSWFRVISFDWQDKSPITVHYVSSRGKSYYGAVEGGYIGGYDELKNEILSDKEFYINFKDAEQGTKHLLELMTKKK